MRRRRYQGKLVPAEEKFPSEDEKFLLDHQESHHNVLHLHSKSLRKINFFAKMEMPNSQHCLIKYELGIHLFVSWVMFICGFSTKVTSNILIFKQLWGNYHNYTLWSQKNFPKMNKPKFWGTENRINILMNPNSHSNNLLWSHQMFSICNVW